MIQRNLSNYLETPHDKSGLSYVSLALSYRQGSLGLWVEMLFAFKKPCMNCTHKSYCYMSLPLVVQTCMCWHLSAQGQLLLFFPICLAAAVIL